MFCFLFFVYFLFFSFRRRQHAVCSPEQVCTAGLPPGTAAEDTEVRTETKKKKRRVKSEPPEDFNQLGDTSAGRAAQGAASEAIQPQHNPEGGEEPVKKLKRKSSKSKAKREPINDAQGVKVERVKAERSHS
jgi:hypothetical protein